MAPGRLRGSGITTTKNSTNEASMLLKTINGCGNEAKKYMETNELYENSENKANKLLKTNDITRRETANYASFAHTLAPIGR
jgi:hypothetical protein